MDDSRSSQMQRRRIVAAASACALGGSAYLAQRQADPGYPRGEPQAVDLTGLHEGVLRSVIWRDRPVFVLKRSAAAQAALADAGGDPQLIDPLSQQSLQPPACRNRLRSLRPDLFVALAQCTHQGCQPALSGDRFVCPCHASSYDLAGRILKGGPAPANLAIPAYRFDGERLLIGADA